MKNVRIEKLELPFRGTLHSLLVASLKVLRLTLSWDEMFLSYAKYWFNQTNFSYSRTSVLINIISILIKGYIDKSMNVELNPMAGLNGAKMDTGDVCIHICVFCWRWYGLSLHFPLISLSTMDCNVDGHEFQCKKAWWRFFYLRIFFLWFCLLRPITCSYFTFITPALS